MKRYSMLALGDWADASWLPSATHARSERARTAATAHLLARFPLLPQAGATQLPWFAAPFPRPAYARLMRLCAVLTCTRALRLVVSSAARANFFRATGALPLTALQCHPRGAQQDLRLDAPVDLFDRHSLTAVGLALALRAAEGPAQRQWLQLRLPRQYAEAAAKWRLANISPQDALELVGDALPFLHAGRTTC